MVLSSGHVVKWMSSLTLLTALGWTMTYNTAAERYVRNPIQIRTAVFSTMSAILRRLSKNFPLADPASAEWIMFCLSTERLQQHAFGIPAFKKRQNMVQHPPGLSPPVSS
jgi:hypothetical protein